MPIVKRNRSRHVSKLRCASSKVKRCQPGSSRLVASDKTYKQHQVESASEHHENSRSIARLVSQAPQEALGTSQQANTGRIPLDGNSMAHRGRERPSGMHPQHMPTVLPHACTRMRAAAPQRVKTRLKRTENQAEGPRRLRNRVCAQSKGLEYRPELHKWQVQPCWRESPSKRSFETMAGAQDCS
jgi:hypothetical protein